MKKLYLLTSFIVLCTICYSQTVDSIMTVYAQEYPQQKIYIHFDKGVYTAGETIFLKSYIFEGFTPSEISNNFYTELYDSDGKLIERKIFPITEATSSGSFDVPAKYNHGTINIKAYTTWMLNFDTSFIYQKSLAVIDKSKKVITTNAEASTSITFFPEGGNLVAGIDCNVAFKANDKTGMPVAVKGEVKDNKGNTVATIETMHDGMGRFSFTPDAAQQYYAKWIDPSGKEQTTVLPSVMAEGLVMTTQIAKGKLIYYLTRTDNVPAEMRSLHVIASFAQAPVYKMDVQLQSTFMTSGIIPIDKMPSGVMQVTVFSNDWKPLAERIVLINNEKHLFRASLTAPEVSTQKRAKNVIEVEVPDTIRTNMSIAVTDAAIAQRPYEENIISKLVLTGDLKGYVHNPGYYFTDKTENAAKHLDLVMMTNGWRKYNWTNVVERKLPVLKYPMDSTLTLTAKVFGLGSKRMAEDEQLVAIIKTKDHNTKMVMMPKTGKDRFGLPIIIYDTVQVYYRFQKDKDLESTATVAIETNFYKPLRPLSIKPWAFIFPVTDSAIDRTKQLEEEFSKTRSKLNQVNDLGMVTVKSKVRTKSKTEELDQVYSNGLFKSINAESFDMTDPSVGMPFNVLSFLHGRVAGITITNPTGINPSVNWRGVATSLFLDETPVDASTLSSINVNNIAYVKVFRPPFLGASGGGAGGGIAVYTKKGVDAAGREIKGLSKATVAGYSIAKEFYVPDYSDPSASNEVSSDYRSTLYWQPYVLTDAKNKKVKIEFFNNDVSKSFRVILEGINDAGQLVRIEKVIQ